MRMALFPLYLSNRVAVTGILWWLHGPRDTLLSEWVVLHSLLAPSVPATYPPYPTPDELLAHGAWKLKGKSFLVEGWASYV